MIDERVGVKELIQTRQETKSVHNERILPLARWYSEYLGFSLIPVGRNKVPLIQEWQKIRAVNASTLETWFSQYPLANLGCVTGSVSRVVVLDVDVSHGEDGLESLRLLEKEFGLLPHTPIAITSTGGQHYYFRYEGLPLKRRIKFRPGLDLLAEESYVVLPPSIGLNGRHYCWDAGAHIEDTELAILPEWLIKVAKGSSRDAIGISDRPRNNWSELIAAGATLGARNQTLTKIVGYLLGKRIDPFVARELVLSFNSRKVHPPLKEDEVDRIINSIVKKEYSKRNNHQKEVLVHG
jgi:putative DNA primase/helicase